MARREPAALEYFAGGVPAGTIFAMSVSSLERIMAHMPNIEPMFHEEGEVCLIALVAYFEAFCKDQFASLINVCPALLRNLAESGLDTTVDATDLVAASDYTLARLGFLLAERLDFGTARKVNAVYTALVRVTPFGRDEIARYDDLLHDRNLLVHHGGIFTSRYAKTVKRQIAESDLFYQSLVITPEYFHKTLLFLRQIVEKTVEATSKAVKGFVAANDLPCSREKRKAIGYIGWSE